MKVSNHFRHVSVFLITALGVIGASLFRNLALGQNASLGSLADNIRVMKTYGKLPLSFEANRGQAEAQVRFMARGAGYSLWLTGKKAVLAFSSRRATEHSPAPSPSSWKLRTQNRPEIARGANAEARQRKTDFLQMQLAGGRTGAEITGENSLPGTVNYFTGNDPARWHTAIPTYSKVRYSGVYPGVDLVFYGNRQQLEYDFQVAPRANAGPIELAFEGARKLALDRQGNLVIHTKNLSKN